ncbi:MAG: N-formylglutamate amidohydrolase [Gammaproteobacteria bacterium]
MKQTILVISCEHGSNKVPQKYAHLFANKQLILHTARAYDIGAHDIAQHLQKALSCELVQSKITRLLVDCEHKPQGLRCFSKFSKKLPDKEKEALIKNYYDPFHQELQNTINHHIEQGQQVLHLSLFTFTPFLKGLFFNTGIGILYDAHRHAEKEVVRIIHSILNHESPAYKVRHNYPFSGTHDHILSIFRKKFAEKDYLGIKLGVNQALLTTDKHQEIICKVLIHTFRELLEVL